MIIKNKNFKMKKITSLLDINSGLDDFFFTFHSSPEKEILFPVSQSWLLPDEASLEIKLKFIILYPIGPVHTRRCRRLGKKKLKKLLN